MPIIRVKDIRDMSSEDRKKKLTELQTELIRLKTMVKAGGSIENPARVRELRKTIARLLTIQNEPQKPETKETREEKPKKKTTRKKPRMKAKTTKRGEE